MKTLSLIGSTGSIGRQTLEVAAERGFAVAGLAAGRDAKGLEEQILRWKPRAAALFDREAGQTLAARLGPDCPTEILWGQEGVCRIARLEEADTVVNAAVGMAGLAPTLAALEEGKTLALANKESLVCAGELVNRLARRTGAAILPVDSEHSAIFQCLQGSRREELERIILTASGGPFFGKTLEETEHMTPAQALRHPNWSMGAKITVDSATMMNKGFEMIEALHLFHTRPEQVQAVIHRESVVHSLAEFRDGSVLAQLSPPDMRLPIQYALDYPARQYAPRQRLDLAAVGKLTFFPPDGRAFPALPLCRRVMEAGGNLGAALNGANEAAVAAFLRGEILFGEIYRRVARAVERADFLAEPALEDILETDRKARLAAME